MHRVLIVDDDAKLSASLRRRLAQEGFESVAAQTGEEGYYLVTTESFDAVVLDWMLPKRDGIRVLHDLRAQGVATPVLILTARDAVEDRVAGLVAGADDYLVKPFAFAELVARLRALLRRNLPARELVLKAGDLEMDLLTRRVVRDGEEIELSGREFELLEYLLRNANSGPRSPLSGGAVYLITQHHLIERSDDGLREELADVMSEVERATDRDGMLAMFDRRFAGHQGFNFQATTASGQRVFTNPRLGSRRLPIPDLPAGSPWPDYRTIAGEGGIRRRLITRRADGLGGELVVQVACSLEDHEHELRELLAAQLIAGPASLLLALGGGYLLARRALAPVDRITAAARDIDVRRLDHRVEVANENDELGRLAATLNGMLDRLERSFREIQRFTADASHELRTPLSVIRSEAEIALGASDPDTPRELLGNILEECERLGWITNQLLTLSREDAGIATVLRKPVDFGRLVRDAAETMRPLADAKGLRLTIDAVDDRTVAGDPVRLRHVLYNLLDNAIKYTKEGGTIETTVFATGRDVRLTVQDNGVGIPAEHLPHVFERFYRVDTARSRVEGGAGLGLAIVQSVVSAHAGRVDVVSDAGVGTTVSVTLPTSASPDRLMAPLTEEKR